jgi:hypothetical protein
VLGVVTWQRAGRPRNYGSVPRGEKISSSVLLSDWHDGCSLATLLLLSRFVYVSRIQKQLNGFLLQEEQTDCAVIHNENMRWLPSNLNN